jgi:hypothetical protein
MDTPEAIPSGNASTVLGKQVKGSQFFQSFKIDRVGSAGIYVLFTLLVKRFSVAVKLHRRVKVESF